MLLTKTVSCSPLSKLTTYKKTISWNKQLALKMQNAIHGRDTVDIDDYVVWEDPYTNRKAHKHSDEIEVDIFKRSF